MPVRLAGEGWPGGAVLRVRMGQHTGEARVRGGAGMDWDQAVAYTLTQITLALSELQPETQP